MCTCIYVLMYGHYLISHLTSFNIIHNQYCIEYHIHCIIQKEGKANHIIKIYFY